VLGVESGGVDVSWSIEGDDIHIRWSEHGGPAIHSSPDSKGFGSALVDATVLRQFGGTLAYDWKRDGLMVEVVIPMAKLAR
jgi:two-component sensor histidine kinase